MQQTEPVANPAPGPPDAAPHISPRTGKRLPRTAWRPGQSGNPSGRPKEVGVVKDAKEAARGHALRMIEILVEIAEKGRPDRARVAAAEAVLDRALGKPAIEITGPDGGPLQIHSWAELVARVVGASGEDGP